MTDVYGFPDKKQAIISDKQCARLAVIICVLAAVTLGVWIQYLVILTKTSDAALIKATTDAVAEIQQSANEVKKYAALIALSELNAKKYASEAMTAKLDMTNTEQKKAVTYFDKPKKKKKKKKDHTNGEEGWTATPVVTNTDERY